MLTPKGKRPFTSASRKYPYKKQASLSGLQTRGKRIDALIVKWREITFNPAILNIELGYKIPLLCELVQFCPLVTNPSQENAHVTYAEVESLLAKDAIVHVSPMKEGFLSLLFVISKKYGTFWPVIDLSFL